MGDWWEDTVRQGRIEHDQALRQWRSVQNNRPSIEMGQVQIVPAAPARDPADVAQRWAKAVTIITIAIGSGILGALKAVDAFNKPEVPARPHPTKSTHERQAPGATAAPQTDVGHLREPPD